MNHLDIWIMTKALLMAALLCLGGGALAQSAAQPAMTRASTLEGPVLMLPGGASTSADMAGGVMEMDGVRVSVSLEGQFQVLRANHNGKEHQIHVLREGPPRWLAFDLEEGRFRDVLSSLRVELDDYARLDEIVEAAGGTGGKSYEQLGFAIVSLPQDANPAIAASKINSMHGVVSATIRLQGPIHVPM